VVSLVTWREIAEAPKGEAKELKEEGARIKVPDCVTIAASLDIWPEIAKPLKEVEKG